MKKALSVSIIVLVLLVGCDLFGITNTSIVGKWGVNGVQAYEFTSTGNFIVGNPSIMTTTFKYTAANGSGQYWFEGYPDAKVSFTYEISGKILTLTIPSISTNIQLTRL